MTFLLINKPVGWTSFDAVAYIRNRIKRANCHPKSCHPELVSGSNEVVLESHVMLKQVQHDKRLRVGHAGTLDPFASGLLIVGVGREATKKLDDFKKMPKTYVATIKLGEISNTYDKTGHITTCHPELVSGSTDEMLKGRLASKQVQHDNKHIPSLKQIKKVINSFKGKQPQIPPMFSAKKIGGKRLYALARKGLEVERKPNEIEIYKIKLLNYAWPFLKIEVQCSTGTYIRSLAHDIGQRMGVGAYCQKLVRTKIGKYSLNKAVGPSELPFAR